MAKPSAYAIMLAASDKLDDKMKKVQRRFVDAEAELSDEEGAVGAVSDDEDEDNDVNDNGELADLITDEKTKAKDMRVTEEYHVQWARQQEAKDLQKVLRGLENGFRRRRFGGLDDGDEELGGRWRRARFGDDDDDLNAGAGFLGAFEFPSGFGGGAWAQGDDDEKYDDEEVLNKARRQRLLAGSQTQEGGGSPIALDEDSQQVLGLLARSASESQQQQHPMLLHAGSGGGGGVGGGNGTTWFSGLGLPPHPRGGAAGSGGGGSTTATGAPTNGARLIMGAEIHLTSTKGCSFVGRQKKKATTKTVRTQSAALGLSNGGRSFVFGRSENSNSALPPDGDGAGGGGGGGGGAVGPVSFANLRQMAGIGSQQQELGGFQQQQQQQPSSKRAFAQGGSSGEQAATTNSKKKKKNAPSLVSRLKQGSVSLFESQESLLAVSAVCRTIAEGKSTAR